LPAHPDVITSPHNDTVKLLTSLRLDKYRAEHGLFLAEGARTIASAMAASHVPTILALDQASLYDADVDAVYRQVYDQTKVIVVSAEVLRKITQKDNPQSVVAAFPTCIHRFDALHPSKGQLYIALDRIRDPGNLGTILRSADAAAAAGVLLIGATCDALSPESVRASTGSIFHVPVFVGEEDHFVALAKSWPGAVVGTAMTAPHNYRSTSYAMPTLLVMGTEQSGLSERVAAACTVSVSIPMYGRAESLNVATAAALMLYAVREAVESKT
jgi:RNA methyltransferase, TrmH family